MNAADGVERTPNHAIHLVRSTYESGPRVKAQTYCCAEMDTVFDAHSLTKGGIGSVTCESCRFSYDDEKAKG